MKLETLLGKDVDGSDAGRDIAISGLSADSRQIKPGYVFAALHGSTSNGADFVGDAVANGAVAILTDKLTNIPVDDVAVFKVDDPRHELATMAARFYPGQPQIMVAITGTAGKTSVASFLRQIWKAEGIKAAMIGTTGVTAPGLVNYASLTTPDPVALHQLLDELAGLGVTHASMEASSHGLDQRRLDGVRLSAAAFTNLGRDHMDYHATVDDYLNAKLRLFRSLLPEGRPAVIYTDNAYSKAACDAATAAGMKVLTVGRSGSFLALKRVEQERYRQIGEIMFKGNVHRVVLPMAGEFQMANALVAAGLAIATGSRATETLMALEHLEGAKGRLELVGKTANGSPVYVDYAHKPDALENVLKALRPYTTGELVVVFGCGGDRDRGKRPIMGEIAGRLADRVIVTDDNPRSETASEVRGEIIAAVPTATEIGDRHEAIHHAVTSLKEGDCLIVAGKGHEEGQIVGTTVLPFSDHQVVREALAENGGSAGQ